jgi:hypothetical protein
MVHKRKKFDKYGVIEKLSGDDRYEVVETISGDFGIQRIRDTSPFPLRWDLTESQAKKYVKKLNSGKYRFSLLFGELQRRKAR